MPTAMCASVISWAQRFLAPLRPFIQKQRHKEKFISFHLEVSQNLHIFAPRYHIINIKSTLLWTNYKTFKTTFTSFAANV